MTNSKVSSDLRKSKVFLVWCPDTPKNNASPKLEASLQERTETKTETSGNAFPKGSTETLQELPHDLPQKGRFFCILHSYESNR